MRRTDESKTKSAALFGLMGALEHSRSQTSFNSAANLCFGRRGDSTRTEWLLLSWSDQGQIICWQDALLVMRSCFVAAPLNSVCSVRASTTNMAFLPTMAFYLTWLSTYID